MRGLVLDSHMLLLECSVFQTDHWFPLMDNSGQIKNIDDQQSYIHLRYSYEPIGEKAVVKKDQETVTDGTMPEHRESTIQRSLLPTENPPARERVVASSEFETTSAPPTGNWHFNAVKNAVRGIKALAANGYEVVLVGNGDVDTSRKAMVALRRAGLVDDDTGPVKTANVLFVENSQEKVEVSKQLGGLVAMIDRDWGALEGVAAQLEDGAQCVLFNPSREGRRAFLQAVMAREADEAALAALTAELTQSRQRLRAAQLALARAGVDIRAQSRVTQEEDPQVQGMMGSYSAEELRATDLVKQIKALMAKTASPLLCVPTTRNEMGLLQRKKADGWEEVCESLGIDVERLRVYDERPSFAQLMKPSPSDPPPFYPLALGGTQEAILRLPHRVDAWEAAKRKGVRPVSAACGVGLAIQENTRSELHVESTEYGGPAFLSRAVTPGDLLISIDGEPLLGMDQRDVRELAIGKPGSMLLLEIKKAGEEETQTVVLERKKRVVVFEENKGRVVVGIDGVVLVPQVDTDDDKGGE